MVTALGMHKNTDCLADWALVGCLFVFCIKIDFMIRPPRLKPNDTVAIVSTARKIVPSEVAPGVELLESWGLKVVLGKTIGLESHQFAGTDEERRSDIQEQLDNPDIKAVWCARGGYGTVRIIDQLDFTKFSEHPKWLIGYSDITVLHNQLHQHGFASLHATMPRDIPKNTEHSLSSLKSALFESSLEHRIYSIKGHVPGSGCGTLVGGNLSILYSLLGSRSSVSSSGKILFLEDVDEYLYHVDRMVINLKRNGYFRDLKGLIIGGFTDMNDNEIPFGRSARELLLEHLGDVSFPVVFDFPAGHLDDNRSLILGAELTMEVGPTEATMKFS
jgi:muramoyltetrapeptide carboxypeptidase